MAGGDAQAPIPPFHVHAGHAFEGFELVGRPDGSAVLIASCGCGAVLDVADARFTTCPRCAGRDGACPRCDGSGQVIDHAALEWREEGGGERARERTG